jgi:hypothetical protein
MFLPSIFVLMLKLFSVGDPFTYWIANYLAEGLVWHCEKCPAYSHFTVTHGIEAFHLFITQLATRITHAGLPHQPTHYSTYTQHI